MIRSEGRSPAGANAHSEHPRRRVVKTPVEPHPLEPVITRAFDIAIACDVTVYDALYVATAERLDVPFVTADTRLIRRLRGTAWAQRSLTLRDLPTTE